MTSEAGETAPWPTALTVKDQGRLLDIAFDNGEHFELTAEFLRVESPSAEVKGHGPGQETTVGGKKDVRIARAEAVGNYAVRLVFDDGHSTGLYSWAYLAKLGREYDGLWAAYLAKLADEGLSRG